MGRVEALERQAGAAGLKVQGPVGFSGYDHALVVRAVDWDDAHQAARGEANAQGVQVYRSMVLWPLGAGVYRVRVTGVRYPSRYASLAAA